MVAPRVIRGQVVNLMVATSQNHGIDGRATMTIIKCHLVFYWWSYLQTKQQVRKKEKSLLKNIQ